MCAAPNPKILCVDDEPLVLEGLTLHLRRSFRLFTAPSGPAGLELLAKESDCAVVVSDMRMPQMSGAQFLAKVREQFPNSVRVLLTGQSDLESAIAAVNEGQIFRFLTKPCPPNVLLSALGSAVRQHELIMAEKVLLEQTLRGCVKTLTDVLSLTNPTAFGRASRAKQHMTQFLSYVHRADDWQAEISAMLSQIGCVTLPGDVLDRMYEGQPLTDEEAGMVAGLPAMAERLLAHIPRLEGVREILLHMDDHYDSKPGQSIKGEALPWGARALKIVLDYTSLEWQLGGSAEALDLMRSRNGWYDPAIFVAFAALQGNAASGAEVRSVTVKELREGMVLHQNLTTRTGMLVMAKGHEITASSIERIANFSKRVGVREPIPVVVNRSSSGHRAAS